MSVACVTSRDANAARAAAPGAIVGGWHWVPEHSGMAVVWAELDRPAPGRVALWRSRQAAEDGDYSTATVVSIGSFARLVSAPPASHASDRALAKMEAAIDRLTERLTRIEGTATLPADLRLVDALAEHSRGYNFTVRDLFAHGARVEPAVLVAIHEACGRLCARRLGIRLAKLAAISLVGFRVERLVTVRDGAVWKVHRLRV